MTRDSEIPDRWPTAGSEDPAGWTSDKKGADPKRPKKKSARKTTKEEPPNPEVETPIEKRRRLGFLRSWAFWWTMGAIASGGVGYMAIALLLKLPAIPNCPSTFWPMASASLRLYCAQVAANKQTADNLVEAIALVNSLPADHGLRPEINRSIEQWSLDLLSLAEEDFDSGKIKQAIATARKIPETAPAYKLVENRVQRWQAIWSNAEKIYQKAESELRQSRWHLAFAQAVRLTNIGNRYWATTKYEQLVANIQLAREESAKLDKAYNLLKYGDANELLQAVKLAEQIKPSSYAYKEAKDLLVKCGNKLLEMAQDRLDKKDWQGTIAIANKMPPSLNLQQQAQGLTFLAQAQSKAEGGNIASLEEAITIAQKIEPGSPMRDKAQEIITRWQREIEDVAHLERARNLAKGGAINDLMAAIAEAQQVPSNNPRINEAKTEMKRWATQIETLQDRPYLERAEQLATAGDVASLQEAILQAGQIGNGRVLYQQAQSKIAGWNGKIQRLQDQPFIDQAEQIATSGNLRGAIETAQQIRPGRALYGEAQNKIRQWIVQIQRQEDQPYLDQADQLANAGNLSGAIATLQQIQQGRALYGAAQNKIRQLSVEIQRQEDQPYLDQADQLANSGNLANAIATAQQIQQGRALYGAAQNKIRQWAGLIQRQEDQPYLDQAQALANSGNLSGAVSAAEQIKEGRSLYKEARTKIRGWQRDLQAIDQLQSATQLANSGTPEALLSAIRKARQVPSSSSAGKNAKDAIARWSYQILTIAQDRSASDLNTAIAIANIVPSGTDAYETAQRQIELWQQSLAPQSAGEAATTPAN
ncbi:chromosome segregation ATPase [Microcoleus sp. FACHB-831]|uniref:chromosome segregation ATPase n=1 Tax=Microcoleus sp. FACHB-831 TaxID=2692827 RepID=UPI0016873902|nr:chromosome segregation ATPase [Microcoleus sp. FACHB-831]MBD1922339.1 chromosome segregation ATPase [Microcoleus sp. FACHB-831]